MAIIFLLVTLLAQNRLLCPAASLPSAADSIDRDIPILAPRSKAATEYADAQLKLLNSTRQTGTPRLFGQLPKFRGLSATAESVVNHLRGVGNFNESMMSAMFQVQKIGHTMMPWDIGHAALVLGIATIFLFVGIFCEPTEKGIKGDVDLYLDLMPKTFDQF